MGSFSNDRLHNKQRERNMRFKLGILLLFFVLMTACSNNEQSSNEVRGETAQESKEADCEVRRK